MAREQIPVSKRAASIEYAIRDVVVPATKLESEGHEIIKLNIGDPIAYPGLPTPKHNLAHSDPEAILHEMRLPLLGVELAPKWPLKPRCDAKPLHSSAKQLEGGADEPGKG